MFYFKSSPDVSTSCPGWEPVNSPFIEEENEAQVEEAISSQSHDQDQLLYLQLQLKMCSTRPQGALFCGPITSCSFPDGSADKESLLQCRRHRRHRFDPWVGKIPWRRKWQPTLVFLPGKSHGQRSLTGYRFNPECIFATYSIYYKNVTLVIVSPLGFRNYESINGECSGLKAQT